ncbi:unnamed protein product [Prorocentrum cordatum]|uniref:ADP,ATP carrier protein n=1 Tax=Prorocentrum cordatum TaxID=2364126 RepID=A0ABN9U403_9DINO|nr:unnamed protein product [Polarella glacialis]
MRSSEAPFGFLIQDGYWWYLQQLLIAFVVGIFIGVGRGLVLGDGAPDQGAAMLGSRRPQHDGSVVDSSNARGCGPGGGIALASQGFAVAPAALHLPAAGGPVAGRVLKHGRRRRPAGAPPRQRRLGTRGRAQRRREGSASAQRPIQRALGRWAAPAVAALLAASAFALPAWAADAGAPVLDIDWSVGRVAKFLAAGGSCASISHAIAVPLDVVKTRHQYDPDRYLHEVTGKPLGIFETGYRITRQEGSLMLLQGLRATSVGYLIQGATKYTLWEFFKALFGLGSAATAASRVAILVAAALLAEVIATVVLCPFERARIKLVSDPTFAPSTVSAFARLEGIASDWRWVASAAEEAGRHGDGEGT